MQRRVREKVRQNGGGVEDVLEPKGRVARKVYDQEDSEGHKDKCGSIGKSHGFSRDENGKERRLNSVWFWG